MDGELTPVGGQRQGNADGTIPPWTGGLAAGPVPFAEEKLLFVITGANAEQYGDRLSPGLLALLKAYPEFRMPVYPSHRTATYPAAVLQRARQQASAVRLQGGGVQQLGGSTIPFPIPENGLEAIWNHLLRYMGGGVERSFDSFSVDAAGNTWKIGFHDTRIYDENFDSHSENHLFSYLGYFLSPSDLVGTYYLVHEPIDQVAESRKAWIYNTGQRRVRRAPELAYDNAQDGSQGMAVVDQYDGYNGAPDRYDWSLKGKKEIYVSYNDYRIADKSLSYDEIIRPHTINSDHMRYELHRVWMVEANLKPDKLHIYARRVFYLDEDSWSVLLDEAYDAKGNLWRTGIHGLVQYAEAQVPWYRFELWHDLNNGSYVLTGLDNAYAQPWKFGVRGRVVDFEQDSLRRLGTR